MSSLHLVSDAVANDVQVHFDLIWIDTGLKHGVLEINHKPPKEKLSIHRAINVHLGVGLPITRLDFEVYRRKKHGYCR